MQRTDLNYSLIEHTADFGIHVRGADPSDLFANAALAMIDQITDLAAIKGRQTVDISVEGADWPDLMVNWLREILYLWNGQDLLAARIDIERIADTGLKALVDVDPYAPERHHVRQEIKAVTYHQIRVDKAPQGWEAVVIFDI
jgi:SHS2 domain-containing protein